MNIKKLFLVKFLVKYNLILAKIGPAIYESGFEENRILFDKNSSVIYSIKGYYSNVVYVYENFENLKSNIY